MSDIFLIIFFTTIVIMLLENSIYESRNARRCLKYHYLRDGRNKDIAQHKSSSRRSLYSALMVSVVAACVLSVSGCSEGDTHTEQSQEVQMCLDQGGDWTLNGCAYANEKCAVEAFCKQDAEFCPCALWENDL